MSPQTSIVHGALCLLLVCVALANSATLNGKEHKIIRIAPTRSSYKVTHLQHYQAPLRAPKGLYACNYTETPGVIFPEEGAHGEIMSLTINGCSSITDDLCSYNIYDQQEFTYQIIFKAGGVASVPRFLTEGSYTSCSWFMCLSLWFDLMSDPIEFDGKLVPGEYYEVDYTAFLDSGHEFETPAYTMELWAAVGDYGCWYPEYPEYEAQDSSEVVADYPECPPDRCLCQIGGKIFEEWTNMETCFKTNFTYHQANSTKTLA